MSVMLCVMYDARGQAHDYQFVFPDTHDRERHNLWRLPAANKHTCISIALTSANNSRSPKHKTHKIHATRLPLPPCEE